MDDVGRLFAGDLQLSDERRTLLRALLAERGLADRQPPAQETVADRGSSVPLSFAQERLWFLHQLEPGSVAYHVAIKVRLRGRFDLPSLRWSLDELARRHETLRTTVALDPADDRPVQRIHPPQPVALDVVDTVGSEPADTDRLTRDLALAPFDLSRGPLLRVRLLRHDARDHTLVLVLHHIVVDAWSIGVMVGELAHLYEHHLRGSASALPKLTYQYADYAAAQRDQLKGERLRQQLDYWRERLADLPVLDLPTDHPRPPVISDVGAELHFRFPVELQTEFAQLCRREGATTFMGLLAAFTAVLARYSGQRDIAVGTPIAGRGRPELDNLIGFFVNTLVLRTDLTGRPSFRDLLRRVRETAVGAYEHQDVPFEQLVDELQPRRTLDRTPLFQVMFGMQTAPVTTIALDGLELSAESVDTGSSMFDLLLTFDERPDGLAGLLTYRTELFTEPTVQRLVRHLRALLEAVVRDPGVAIDTVDLLGTDECRHLLRLAAGPQRPREPECLHHLFEEQVRRTPGAVAARSGDTELSYAELNRRAERLARRLRAHGVGPEVRVGITVERSCDLVVALLATLKSGGCAVPVDLSYPSSRRNWILRDADVAVLLTGRNPVPAPECVPMIPVGATGPLPKATGDIGAGRAAEPENLAYLIYTSGSTGNPKGVMVRHASLVNHMRWMQETFPLRPDDRVLQKTAVGFDASVWEFWAPLAAGACVVLPPPGIERDAAGLVRAMHDEQITVLQVVPGLLDVLVDEPALANNDRLRRVYCGGEALPAGLAARFHATLPAELVNLYGPAETCIDAVTAVSTPAARDGATVPIGSPITNMRAYVLDDWMNLVPLGVVGELHLGGAGLGRGYLGRPELTAQAFVPDRFAGPGEAGGGLLYRTGDLVRRRPDGTLEYLGRRDQQIKIRGTRIEPAEIEAELVGHPAVRRAAVVPVADPAGVRLVAYVVPCPGHVVQLTDLRAYLMPRLPEAMHPSDLVILDELPQSPNGKLDRSRLPALEPSAPVPGRAPGTPLERLLCEQYAVVLGHQRIDPDLSFFDLGGNSLQAMRLVSRLGAALGEPVPVSLLFQDPSPAALATRLAHRPAGLPAAVADPQTPDGTPRLSFAQRRMWFLQHVQPERSDYNVAVVARLTGPLDQTALERALTALTERHPVLRTRFASVGSAVRAVVDEVGVAPFAVEEPADVPDAVARTVREPFDLRAGPVWRARLLRTGPVEHVLAVAVHHVAIDGASSSLLIRDLAQLYAAHRRGSAAGLRPLPATYADFAAWQQRWMSGPQAEAQLAYWRRQLSGVQRVRLGRTPEAVVMADRPGASLPVEVPGALRGRLAVVARSCETTMFQILVAAFAVTLHQETGQPDLAIGTDIARRPLPGLEEVVGPFVNQVVLRTSVVGQPTFRDLLTRVRRICEQAQANADIPFENVVAAVNPAREGFADPLVDVKLIFSDAGPSPRFDDVTVTAVDLPVHTVKHDLDFFLTDDGERIAGALHYAFDALDRPAVEALRDHFLVLLAACTADPDLHLHELPSRTREQDAMPNVPPADPKRATFSSIRPRRVRADAGRMVNTEPFSDTSGMPLSVRPAIEDLDVAGWATANRGWIDDQLTEAGAVLFRGFGIEGPEAFERVAQSLCTHLYEENGEHTPVAAGSSVQEPVFYPPDRELLWHHENSFNDRWPTKIMFCCRTAPDTGGDSTLADSRLVYARLEPAIRRRFEEHGVLYQRSFGDGFGVGWEQIYGTTDRAVVEQRCRDAGIVCEWRPGNRLRTTAVRPATVRHPRSGAWSWFNQAQHWHTSCLDPQTRSSLLAMFDEPDLPRNCYYGDGSPIEDDVMAQILDVYRGLSITIPWCEGDFMLVDNVSAAHGRTPFTGTRRMLVALGDEAHFVTQPGAAGAATAVEGMPA